MMPEKKCSMFLLISLTFLFSLLYGCSATPEGNPAEGERWFKLYRCVGCHGESGSGGKGPVIAGISLNYNRFLHKLRAPNSAIMPAYDQQRLPDSDAAEIYLWLKQQKK